MTRIASGITDQGFYFVAVDATDFTTRETGLATWTVYRERNNGTAAAMTTPTITEADATNMPGVYFLLCDEDMTIGTGNDTEEMAYHITHAGMAPVTHVVELYRPKITVGNTLGVASDGDVSGNVDGTVAGIAGTITTLDALDTAQDTQHSTTRGLIGTPTDFGSGTSTLAANLQDMADNGTATFDRSTDSLQAIRDRGDAAWASAGSLNLGQHETTIATLASQTSFTLTAGSADNDAYNGWAAYIQDASTSTQVALGQVSDYVGSTRTVTLTSDPGIFTMAAGDTIVLLPAFFDEGVNVTSWNSVALSTTNPLPNAAPDAAGGLVISDAGGLDIDTLNSNVSAVLTDTGTTLPAQITALNDLDAAGVRAAVGLASANLDTQIAALPTAAENRAEIDSNSTQLAAILTDTGTTLPAQISGLNDLDAAGIRSAVGLASANLDTQLAATDTVVDNLNAGIIYGTSVTGTLTTTVFTTDLTGYADDQLIGRTITFYSGDADGEQAVISDYASTGGTVTISAALTTAPTNGATFKIT